MIRIPTGPIPAPTARTVALLLGLAGVATSFVPALKPFAGPLREVSALLAALGITVGDARKPIKVPT